MISAYRYKTRYLQSRFTYHEADSEPFEVFKAEDVKRVLGLLSVSCHNGMLFFDKDEVLEAFGFGDE